MLVIGRKIGGEIYIGNEKLTVIDIKPDNFVIEFGGNQHRINRGMSVSLGETEVFFSKQYNDKILIAFDGPRTTRILRGEIYSKDSQAFIDNSTKQFPSGGNY